MKYLEACPVRADLRRLLTVFTAAAVLCLATSGAPRAGATGGEADDQELTDLTLEELMDMEVTIASRKGQKLSDSPGAVYVITGDEIRRAGHTSVQEALRMVPGLYVSNWTTSQWDVTSRGFGTGLSLSSLAYLNQLLVMIDGVVVYSPLFAGTWWALQDVDLNDVDRVEVVRGPGGILWGGNAVHGVINIITKHSTETQGFQAAARVQTDERNGTLRWGSTFGETGTYRAFYRYVDVDSAANPYLGFDQGWYLRSAGARFDWGAERKNVVWARAYEGGFGADGFDTDLFEAVPVMDAKEGFQLFGSSTNAAGDETISAWLTYDSQDLPTELDYEILAYDLEYRREFALTDSTRLVGGVGFRQIHSDLEGFDPFYITFDPEQEVQSNYRAFLLHEWDLERADLDVVFGAQVENNHFTGWEFQPTARLNWHPREDFSMWMAATRSVRTPSLEEVSLDQNSALIGDPNFEAENARTYELGVRKLIGDVASLDLALFSNEYDDLHLEVDNGFGQGQISNGAEGQSYGAELALDLRPLERWSVRSAYSFIEGQYENALDGSDLGTEDRYPMHQFNLRSYLDLSETVELDGGVYVVEGLGGPASEAERWRLDLRLGWRPKPDVEVFVGAQQLNDSLVSEFDEFDLSRRQFFVGMRWSPGVAGRP